MNLKSFTWNFRGRRSLRFQDRDYSLPGNYFVTICTKGRECLFGTVQNGVMQLNDVGRIIEREWLRTAEIRPNVSLGPWVIMPNHVHMIVTIRDSEEPRYRTVGAHCVRPDENESIVMLGNSFPSSHPISVDQTDGQSVRGARSAPLPRLPNSLASLIAGFKAKATSEYRRSNGNARAMLWQRNYWESVINSERQYVATEDYILNNPAAWDRDELNPAILHT